MDPGKQDARQEHTVHGRCDGNGEAEHNMKHVAHLAHNHPERHRHHAGEGSCGLSYSQSVCLALASCLFPHSEVH